MLDGCETTDCKAPLMIAMEALIGAGIDTRPRIVGAAQSLGFKPSTLARCWEGVASGA